MYRKSEGFFLIELLLSFSALLLVSLFLIPDLIFLRDQARQTQIEKEAYQLLYEELKEKISVGGPFNNYSLDKRGTRFTITWSDRPEIGKKEVCVQVEGTKFSEGKVCELLE